ncbi:hypothetical protein Leryth_006093 [Lithospermum erythrorhizon]|nr:hypothetical protein Leryth_006093 [Lithospermum erythrorhizon]
MEHYQPHNNIDPSLPPQFFTADPNQTSYDEMIMAAISGLGEKDGSSRQAIARYIDRVYSNLPSNHSILLTNHLRNLKNSGQLIMVKHSYLLPSGSAPPPTTTTTTTPKKRGRPPKPKADPASAQHFGPAQNYSHLSGPNGSVQNVPNGPVEASIKRKPGRPPKSPDQAQPISGFAPVEDNGGGANGSVSESEAMLVSLGLSDGPVPTKMRPRRAIKSAAAPPHHSEDIGRKKRPGRPRKVAPPAPGVWPVQVPVGAVVSGSGRGRGRPRKFPLSVVPANGGVNGVQPKKRGRKPKSNTQNAGFSVPVGFMMPEQMNGGGGGGVMMPQAPYTQAGGAAAVAAAAGVVSGEVPFSGGYNGVVYPGPGKRGRGRPPRMDGSVGLKKARKLSGKPLGRPRKNSSASEDQSLDIVNLKNKIDYLQSKIKEALPVIKSSINAEEPNIIGALGQLEELATVDFTAPAAPVNVQMQQHPPTQQLQAEHQ